MLNNLNMDYFILAHQNIFIIRMNSVMDITLIKTDKKLVA